MIKAKLTSPGSEIKNLIDNNIIVIEPKDLKVLDIGFGDPDSLIFLQHLYGFKDYVGIDKIQRSNFKIRVSFDDDTLFPEDMVTNERTTPYEHYKLFYKYTLNNIPVEERTELSQPDFEKIFQFHFETPVQTYLKENTFNTYKPNLLILSDILHKIEDKDEAQEVYFDLLKRLDINGLVWVQVYNLNTPVNSSIYPYSFQEIETLKDSLDIIFEEERPDKTLFIGRKIS